MNAIFMCELRFGAKTMSISNSLIHYFGRVVNT